EDVARVVAGDHRAEPQRVACGVGRCAGDVGKAELGIAANGIADVGVAPHHALVTLDLRLRAVVAPELVTAVTRVGRVVDDVEPAGRGDGARHRAAVRVYDVGERRTGNHAARITTRHHE